MPGVVSATVKHLRARLALRSFCGVTKWFSIGLLNAFFLCSSNLCSAQSFLGKMRSDIANGVPSPPSSNSFSPKSDKTSAPSIDTGTGMPFSDDESGELTFKLIAIAVTSPIWAPMYVLNENYRKGYYFSEFPYADSTGYMLPEVYPNTLPWSLRLRTDYSTNFDRLDNFSGQLLFETTSRFGFKASGNYFEEKLLSGKRDRVYLGDDNLVYRFAQSKRALFRAGVGANWLLDRQDSKYGVNVTYGADFFPGKPWVISTNIDMGNVGRAGVFRFRTTGGIVIHGIEAYTGYQYFDVGRSHTSQWIAGIGFWF